MTSSESPRGLHQQLVLPAVCPSNSCYGDRCQFTRRKKKKTQFQEILKLDPPLKYYVESFYFVEEVRSPWLSAFTLVLYVLCKPLILGYIIVFIHQI